MFKAFYWTVHMMDPQLGYGWVHCWAFRVDSADSLRGQYLSSLQCSNSACGIILEICRHVGVWAMWDVLQHIPDLCYLVNSLWNSITYEVTLGEPLILRYVEKGTLAIYFSTRDLFFFKEACWFSFSNVKSKCTKDEAKLKRLIWING